MYEIKKSKRTGKATHRQATHSHTMNIFWLIVSLYYKPHINKMILESTQLLYAVWHGLTESREDVPVLEGTEKAYEPTHASHPCTLWCASSAEHYNLLCDLALEMCVEYNARRTLRGEESKPHSCEAHLRMLKRRGYPTQGNKSGGVVYRVRHKKKDTELIYLTPHTAPSGIVSGVATKDLPAGVRWLPLAMPEEFRKQSAIESYMLYYLSKPSTMGVPAVNVRIELMLEAGDSVDEILSHFLSMPSSVPMPDHLHGLAREIISSAQAMWQVKRTVARHVEPGATKESAIACAKTSLSEHGIMREMKQEKTEKKQRQREKQEQRFLVLLVNEALRDEKRRSGKMLKFAKAKEGEAKRSSSPSTVIQPLAVQPLAVQPLAKKRRRSKKKMSKAAKRFRSNYV